MKEYDKKSWVSHYNGTAVMFSNNRQNFLTNVAVALFCLLAGVVILYSLYLLIIGQALLLVPESIPGAEPLASPQETGIEHRRHPAAVLPLLAAIALLFGVRARRFVIAWLGMLLLAVFTLLFLFGIGGSLLPASGLLLLLLAFITWQWKIYPPAKS